MLKFRTNAAVTLEEIVEMVRHGSREMGKPTVFLIHAVKRRQKDVAYGLIHQISITR